MAGADFLYTDVWVSMGEPAEDVGRPHQAAAALPGQRATSWRLTGNPDVKFMHCLPALHDTATALGRQIARQVAASTALEVTDDVFESPASIVFDQAENRLHTIKAAMVATIGRLTCAWSSPLGGNALLERGEVPTRRDPGEAHRRGRRRARPAWPRDHELVITHGNGPQVGLLAHRERRRPRPARIPTRSTCSAPRPRA